MPCPQTIMARGVPLMAFGYPLAEKAIPKVNFGDTSLKKVTAPTTKVVTSTALLNPKTEEAIPEKSLGTAFVTKGIHGAINVATNAVKVNYKNILGIQKPIQALSNLKY